MSQRPGTDIYAEPEDTAETGIRIPLWSWLRRTSEGFGQARAYFLPIGLLALLALAAQQGHSAFEQLASWAVAFAVAGMEKLAGALSAGEPVAPETAYLLKSWLDAAWTVSWIVWLWLCCLPHERDDQDLGYVVPGSWWLARTWAVVGKQLYRMKKLAGGLWEYLRLPNVEKLVLPPALAIALVLGACSCARALGNLAFEAGLAVGIEGAGKTTWWTLPVAALAALLVGAPSFEFCISRLRARATRRVEQGVNPLLRLLAGTVKLFVLAVPAAWMAVLGLAGALN